MKKTILILALVLSLALVGCQGPSAPANENANGTTMIETNPDEVTNTPAADSTATVKLSAEDAIKIFTDKYANVKIDEISFEKDNGVYAYEINGFEYEMEINAADGSIIKEKSEKDNTADKKAIDLGLIKNIDELVATSLKDAGDGYHLDSFSIEHEAGITKLDIEVEDANGKDIEYEYNLETKELIKKDK